MTRPAPGVRFRPADTVDFVIVGSGAAGGIMAKELATAGFTVVVFEQGPRVEPSQFEHDEVKTFFQSRLSNTPAKQPQTFRKTEAEVAKRPGGGGPFGGGVGYHRLVGGGSVMFTANYWRLHEIDFVEGSRLGPISGTGLVDWPITYAVLRPFYTKAESALSVPALVGTSFPPL